MVGVVHRSFASTFFRDKGAAKQAKEASLAYLGKPSERGVPYGDLVAQVEMGYASGDANPLDGTQRRFVFDPNHRVGLLLFDEVLRFATARASTAAQDPLLTNATRPPPGVDLLPSNETLAAAELYLAGRQNRDRVLCDRLAQASSSYDFVVLDCSPSLSLMNQNALVFADSVLVPVACDYLSLVGDQLRVITLARSRLDHRAESHRNSGTINRPVRKPG